MGKFKTDFSREELNAALHNNDSEALAIIKDLNKWENFKKKIEEFLKKARKIPVLGGFVDDIITMVSLVDSYVKKEYMDIPVGTIVSIVAALIYLLSPIDLIPDVIPVIGYLDDAAVIMLVLGLGVNNDLNKYRGWQEENKKKSLLDFEKIFSEEISQIIADGYLAAVILSENEKIKFLVTNQYNNSEMVECRVKEVCTPLEILQKYEIETVEEIVKLLSDTIKIETVRWMETDDRDAYYEPDFLEKWDHYIIVEEV